MEVTINKWGNSLAIRIPQKILNTLGLTQNCRLELKESEGKIILTPCDKPKSFADLFAGYEENDQIEEYDFGEEVGKEIW